MEAERDPGGQVNAGDRLAGEVLGSEKYQVRGAAVRVVDVGHNVAVVLGGAGCGGGEYRLAGGGVLAEFVCLHRARGEVVFEQGVAERVVAKLPLGEIVAWPTAAMTAL